MEAPESEVEAAPEMLVPLSARAKELITRLLARNGWSITIDFFAEGSNRMAPRFASWTDEPESEAVDAFTVPSWSQSLCKCGRVHSETGFFFPPINLERTVVRRAR